MKKKRLSKQEKKELKLKRKRNLLHDHPLLRKGGEHQETRKDSKKKNRSKDKINLNKEWYSPVAFT